MTDTNNPPVKYEGIVQSPEGWSPDVYGENKEYLSKPIGTFKTAESYLNAYMGKNYGQDALQPSDYLSFWQDPVKLSRYKIALDSLPPGVALPDWYNKEAVDKAWAFMSAANPGKYWYDWNPLSPDNAINNELRGLKSPPIEAIPDRDWGGMKISDVWSQTGGGDDPMISYLMSNGMGDYSLGSEEVTGALTDFTSNVMSGSYQPGAIDSNITGTAGMDDATYHSLPYWKQAMVWIGNSGVAGSAAQAAGTGAVMGLATNGIPGAIFGSVLGGGLGAGASATQESMPWLAKTLNTLNLPAEGLERLVGMYGFFMEAGMRNIADYYIRTQLQGESKDKVSSDIRNQEDSVQSILDDLPAAWKAAALTYETTGTILSGGKVDYLDRPEATQLKPGTYGVDAYHEARKMISDGASLEDVRAEFATRYGVTGQLYDLAGQILADPLNLIPAGLLAGGSKIAEKTGNTALKMAFDINKMPKFTKTGKLLWRESDGIFRVLTKTYPTILRENMEAAAKIPGKFGMWSRHLAGIDLDMNGVPTDHWFTAEGQAEVRKKKLFSLTPESRAEESASSINDHLNIYIKDAASADEVTKIVTSMASTDVDVAAQVGDGSWANSAESAGFVLLARDTAKKMPELQETLWDIHETDRNLFNKLAKAAGVDVEGPDGVVNLNKFMNSVVNDSDNVLAQIKRALSESPDGQKLLAILDDPNNPVKGADLRKRANKFIDGSAVMTLDEYKARVMAFVSEDIGKGLVKWFDVKPDKFIFRLSNTIKNTQSIMLLGMNPMYFVNNVLNNEVTMAFSGVLGTSSRKSNSAFWKRMGVEPERRLSGIGAADVGKLEGTHSPISAAKQADGVLSKVDNLARKFNKFMPFTNLSQVAEKGASDVATTVAAKKAWNSIHKAGVGFKKMPKPAENALKSMGIDPSVLYAAIENGMNVGEIEKNLWDTVTYNYLSQVSSPEQTKLLQDVGIFDSLSSKLQKAKTNSDITDAFSGAKDDLYKHAQAQAAADTVATISKWYGKVITEGNQAAFEAFDTALMTYGDFFSAHQKKLDDFYEQMQSITDVRKKRALKEKFFRDADKDFKMQRQDRDKMLIGVCQALLGNGSPEEVKLTDNLFQSSAIHDNFFGQRSRIWNDLFNAYDGDDVSINDFTKSVTDVIGEQRVSELKTQYADNWLYRAAEETNRVNYRNMNVALDDIQLDIDNLFIDMFEKHYPGGKNAAIAWRANARMIHQVMVEAEDYFRHGADGNELYKLGKTGTEIQKKIDKILGGSLLSELDNTEKNKLWKKYHKEIKEPLIADQVKAARYGDVNIADAAAKVEPVKQETTRLMSEADVAKEVERYTILQKDYEATAKKNFEVDLDAKKQADEVRTIVQQPDKYIVNIVNKYGDKKVKSISEITPEMAHKAMEERARVKAEDAAKVVVEGEVDKGAEALQAFGYAEDEIAKTVEARDRSQGVPTDYWSMTLDDFINKDRLQHDQKYYSKRNAKFVRLVHKDSVRKALEAGEDVPPEVLKDYPELMRTAPRTAEELDNILKNKETSLASIADNSHGIYNREAFARDLLDVFDLPQEQADAVMAVLDAQADYWGRRAGKAPERWWTENIAGATKGGDGVLDQTAWHGTPHNFDKFTLDHIGTGEGAQAYGWGLYFAGKEEVARWYAENLGKSPNGISMGGKEWVFSDDGYQPHAEWDDWYIPSDTDEYNVLSEILTTGDFEEVKNKYLYNPELSQFISEMEDVGDVRVTKSALYKVDIPDEGYLLWDKPFSEQPEAVRESIRDIIKNAVDEAVNAERVYHKDSLLSRQGDSLLNGIDDVNGSILYGLINRDPKEASLALKKAGITGIKYLDGSSRSKGEGSFNYVIFDEDAIQMLEKNTLYQSAQPGYTYTTILDADQMHGYALALSHQPDQMAKALEYESPASRIALLDALHKIDPAMAEKVAKETKGVLWQGAKGATDWVKDGLAMIHALEGKDVSTAVHESAHVWLRSIVGVADDDIAVVTKWLSDEYGYKLADDWVTQEPSKFRDAHEAFARAFEKYLQEGNAPKPELQRVFDSFKQWLTAIYRKLRGLDDVKLTDEVRTLFDKWLGGETQDWTPNEIQSAQNALGRVEGIMYFDRPHLPEYPYTYYSKYRPLSAGWAKLPEGATFGKTDANGEIRWIASKEPLPIKTIASLELQAVGSSAVDLIKHLYEQSYGRIGETITLKSNSLMAFIHPKDGKWQSTHFNEDALLGHSIYNTFDEAIDESIREGFREPLDPNVVDYYAQNFAESDQKFKDAVASIKKGGEEQPLPDGLDYLPERPVGEKPVREFDKNTLFQEAPKSIPPVQAVAGTIDSLLPPPQASAIVDGIVNKVSPVLDDLHMKYLKADAEATTPKGKLIDQMRAGIKKANPGITDIELENILNSGTKEIRKYLAGVYNDMKGEKLLTMKMGLQGRDYALLNYTRRTNFDNYLGVVFPYQFWYTRSMLNWASRGLDRPAMLANYVRLRKFQSEMGGKDGMPYRLKNKSFVELPFLPDWMGEGVYFDPLKQIYPFEAFTRPFEQLASQKNTTIKKAQTILHQWESEGEADPDAVTEALRTQSGDLWKRAMAQADIETEQEIQNPFDFAQTMVGTSLPINYAYNMMMGRPERISQLPITRFVQAMTGMAGIGGPAGTNLEAPIRKAVGLPEMDRYYDYRVNRMLAGMAAEGTITAEQAKEAMVGKSGQVFDLARHRVAQMGFWQYLGAPLAVDFFPEGEQEQRGIKKEYGNAIDAWKAGDDKALTTFFDKYPEYEAQMLAWKDPEEQLHSFLISEVWDRYSALPAIHKKQVQEQFGDTFQMAFLDKETRSYDAISSDTLSMWAQALNGFVPKEYEKATIPLKLADDDIAKEVDKYYAERKAKFGDNYNTDAYSKWRNDYLAKHPEIITWVQSEQSDMYNVDPAVQELVYQYRALRDQYFPNIYKTQEEYYLYDKEGRKAYLEQHPELAEYWDWRKQMASEAPQAATYILSDAAVSEALSDETPYQLIQITRSMSSQLYRQFMGYLYGDERISSGGMKELTRLWQDAGEPEGDVDTWLEQAKASQ